MRFVEIAGNVLAAISNEERIVLEKARSQSLPLMKKQLSEREAELARRLVHRGIFDRVKVNEDIGFSVNLPEDVWRDR